MSLSFEDEKEVDLENYGVEEAIKDVMAHESIKAADAAIALNAFRMGNLGYEGEPLPVKLREVMNNLILAERARIAAYLLNQSE